VKALVTGVAGFIGSRLASRLLEDGHRVVGIDAFTDYYATDLKEVNVSRLTRDGFQLVRGDLNTADLGELLSDVDVVFHQAGQPGVRQSWGETFATYTRQNVDATQRLLEAARFAPRLTRVVYASSSSVYGDAERYPTLESDLPAPISPYGVTKLAAEHLMTLYARVFAVPTVSLRYFTVYGPGQRPDMAFTRFTRAAVNDDPIHIYGTGEQVRDFTFVDDVVEANIRAATAQVAPGSVFNVAGGSNVSVNDVLSVIERIHGRPLRISYEDAAAGDVRRTGADTGAIRAALGWQAAVALDDGLAAQYEWAAASSTSSAAS